MAEPSRLLGQMTSNNNGEDSDMDAEHEEDDAELDHMAGTTDQGGETTDAEGSDVDAEGEEIDEEDEGEPVGAVKVAVHRPLTSDGEEDEDHDDGEVVIETDSDAKTSESEHADSSSESEAEEWQAGSDDGEEADAEATDPNGCIFCGGDEDHDPSPEFEEILACAVCGDNAHRQCARDANLSPDDDPAGWRCPACIQNGLESHRQSPESTARRRLSSVPKLARDLLPSHRGADPGGHSMFNDLILPDDPLDGSRSLRKRKASHDEEQPVLRSVRKKRRPSETSKSGVESETPHGPPSPRGVRLAVSDAIESDDARASASERDSSRLRPSRARRARPKRSDKRPLVWLEDSVGLSLVVVFHLNNEKVQKILSVKPKKKRIRDRSRKTQIARPESPEMSHYPAIQTHYAAPFYGFADKETDESKNKPYGGILSEADADTSKTYPTAPDRKRFEDARSKAEEDWKKKQAALYGSQEPSKPAKVAGPPSKIKCIQFGGWEIDTWHAAPYPEEYSKNKVLYICEFCLKYMNSDYVAWRHKLKCPAKHPPGDEIYRDSKYSFFEVDGRKNPVYCQNLCLLAKLFLGSKTLYYDVEPFLFYVMTENDNYGCHFVGYFSKEKRPSSLNNVSCILVLPIHQRKGYGQFLIEFSYLLTRVEKKTGSPEKPLSDMGLVSYRKYWRLVLCQELLQQKTPLSITALAQRTGMTPDDIVSGLEGLHALLRDPVTKTYALRLDYRYFREYIEKSESRDQPKINPDALVWTPYVTGRTSQYEDGPELHTVQPREEVDEENTLNREDEPMGNFSKLNGNSGESNNGSAGAKEDGGTPVAEDPVDSISPTPHTPGPNGSFSMLSTNPLSSSLPSIPPSRYEIFPPIPGMKPSRRRPGRPFGTRRRTGTPQRNRNLPLTIATAPHPRSMQMSPSRNGSAKPSPSANGALTPSGSISVRRTRSKLGESVINGLGEEAISVAGGEVKAVNGRRIGTRSTSGSPKEQKNGKGKEKIVEMEIDGVNGNGHDSGDDIDAEGEMDLDAEGEEDTVDVIMPDA
jgi:histone acetyltransferase SAS3